MTPRVSETGTTQRVAARRPRRPPSCVRRRPTGGAARTPHRVGYAREESMTPHRILIVYATSYGQTAKVARHVADLLLGAGHTVALANADALPRGVTLRDV